MTIPLQRETEEQMPRPHLTEKTEEYLRLVWKLSREHHERASTASRKWRERKAYLKSYVSVNGYTEKQIRDKFALDWELNDAMDEWSWNAREAQRLDSLILKEKAVRDLLGISYGKA